MDSNLMYPSETKIKPFDEVIKSHFKSKKNIVGVEIGVSRGDHTIGMLTHIPNISKLYLVDPYIEYLDGRIFRNQRSVRMNYRMFVKEVLKTDYAKKVEFLKETSDIASSKIPKVDFIYVDGNHSYEAVKKDLQIYYPKLKKGGIIGGDDYNYPRFEGVTRAVDEFVKENKLQLKSKEYRMQTVKVQQGWLFNTDWWIYNG